MILDLIEQYFWDLVLPYIITPFYMLAAPVAIYLFFRPPRGPAHSTCGKCHYPVQGLSALKCPECGSDLRDVGIESPGRTRPLPRSVVLLLWTVAFAPVVWIFSDIFLTGFGPYVRTEKHSWEVTFPQNEIVGSIIIETGQDYLTLGRWFSGNSLFKESANVEWVILSYDDQIGLANAHMQTLDLRGFTGQPGSMTSLPEATHAEVQSWVESLNLELTGMSTDDFSKELSRIVELVFQRPDRSQTIQAAFSVRSSVNGAQRTHPDWIIWFGIFFWSVLFLAGCFRILRR